MMSNFVLYVDFNDIENTEPKLDDGNLFLGLYIREVADVRLYCAFRELCHHWEKFLQIVVSPVRFSSVTLAKIRSCDRLKE